MRLYKGVLSGNGKHPELSDLELVKRVQKGDREAFTLLVWHYSSTVFGAALAYSRHPYDAEDIPQEVLPISHSTSCASQNA